MLGICVYAMWSPENGSSNCSGLVGANYTSCIYDRNLEIGLLSAGVIASRIGLWSIDLSVSQQLQEWVDPSIVGVVNGVQGSLCTVFDMLQYVFCIIFSNIDDFKYLVTGSVAMVGVSALLYTIYSFGRNLNRGMKVLPQADEGDDASLTQPEA